MPVFHQINFKRNYMIFSQNLSPERENFSKKEPTSTNKYYQISLRKNYQINK